MSQVSVRKIGTDTSPIFATKVVLDNGAIERKNIAVSSPTTITQNTQDKVVSYIQTNAVEQSEAQLTSGAQSIVNVSNGVERFKEPGTAAEDGSIVTYVQNAASEIYDGITSVAKSIFGFDIPSPNRSAEIGEAYTISREYEAPVKITPYSDIVKTPANPTLALKDVIGGADLSVFFVMSYPSVEDGNLSLPRELQKNDFFIIELDNVLSISYSIIREKFPVRSLGHINPQAILSGIRTITGSMACTIFSDDVLAYLRGIIANRISQIDSKFDEFFDKDLNMENYDDYKEKLDEWEGFKQYYQKFLNTREKVQLLDALPPFHILVMGVNETGVFSKLFIKNVSVIDENQYQGTQQPNAINKITFTALDIVPLATFTNNQTVISSLTSIDEMFINGILNSQFNISYEITGTQVLDDISDQLNKDDLEISSDDAYYDEY